MAASPVEGSAGPGAGPSWRANAQSGPPRSTPHAALLGPSRAELTGAGSPRALGTGNSDQTRSGGFKTPKQSSQAMLVLLGRYYLGTIRGKGSEAKVERAPCGRS